MVTFAILLGCIIVIGCWLGWQLLLQNGRLLLRLDAVEQRLNELYFSSVDKEEDFRDRAEAFKVELPTGQGHGDRVNRFGNHSLVHSRIQRDGLKAGTPAPDFRLPRLDGAELALIELRGKPVLLVFSSPNCGPCEELAPELEKFHRKNPEMQLLMISKGEPTDNRVKIKEHGLTFPVVLQQQWEISRRYAMFATPVAYLIDEAGVIAMDVAVGVAAIKALLGQSLTDRELTPS